MSIYLCNCSLKTYIVYLKQDAFKARHYDKISAIVDSNKTEKLQENLAKVEVYFQSFDFEKIEEKPSYTVGVFVVSVLKYYNCLDL